MKKTNNTWYIGDVAIDGRVGLAPMAGVCDTAYRLLAKEQRASLVCTEMVSAMGIKYANEHTKELLYLEQEEHPVSMQIFGSNPEAIALAAKTVEMAGADILDINMGCPVKKIVTSGDGSALLKTPDLAIRIVEAAVKSVTIPVTVKMRIGWDEDSINAVPFAQSMEAAGAAALCVHGRTRVQMYSGKADWETIRLVKESVSIPVIANGDATDPLSAKELLDTTGCEAVSIGRGAQGNPWIFNRVRTYLETGHMLPEPSDSEKMAMLRRHFQLLINYKGERIAVREIRTHAGWYIKGMVDSAKWRNILNRTENQAQFLSSLDDYESYLSRL